MPYKKKQGPCKNSQAIKNGTALKNLGEKGCEIKDGSQEMATNMDVDVNYINGKTY